MTLKLSLAILKSTFIFPTVFSIILSYRIFPAASPFFTKFTWKTLAYRAITWAMLHCEFNQKPCQITLKCRCCFATFPASARVLWRKRLLHSALEILSLCLSQHRNVCHSGFCSLLKEARSYMTLSFWWEKFQLL